MPNIPLATGLGLDLTGQLLPGSKLPQILHEFATFKDATLDVIPVEKARAGLNFDRPLDVSIPGLSLEAGVAGGGTVAVLKPQNHVTDPNDPFDNIGINSGEIYLELGIDLSVTASAGVAVQSVGLGLSGEADFAINCYRSFKQTGNKFPTFLKALSDTAHAFLLPRDRGDLLALDQETVHVISGTGTLTASATFQFATPTRQIASVSPVAGHPIEVNASGALAVEVEAAFSGGYQIRLRKTAPQTIELGVYKSKSRELAVELSADAGVAATVGSFNLAEKFIQAISRQPVVDVEEFRRALPGGDETARDLRIAGFQQKLTAAITEKIQASISAGLSGTQIGEAVWMFEIDLQTATSQAAIQAIDAAFKGDFRLLTSGPADLPAGIVQKQNILTATHVSKLSLQVNLLGLVNFLSVGKLIKVSSVEKDAAGEITLVADSADENGLRALLLNVGGNVHRLRNLLSEDFLIQATYKVANAVLLPPEFTAKHTYFEVNDGTSAQAFKDMLDVARVLGILSQADVDQRLKAQSQFGRVTFYAQTKYGSGAILRLFLDDSGRARQQEEFETIGRAALHELLSGDTGQEIRQRLGDPGPAGGALWKQMNDNGNVSTFNQFFGVALEETNPQVAAAGSDFLCILDWATAMRNAAEAIQEVEQILSQPVSALSDAVSEARKHLQARLADVVKHSSEHFGDPLGLVMVFLGAKRAAETHVIATGDKVPRLDVIGRPPALVAGA